jgi:hypothetical protein
MRPAAMSMKSSADKGLIHLGVQMVPDVQTVQESSGTRPGHLFLQAVECLELLSRILEHKHGSGLNLDSTNVDLRRSLLVLGNLFFK